MPKFAIDKILAMPTENFQKLIHSVRYSELLELQLLLNDSVGKIKTDDEVKFKELQDIFFKYYQEKEKNILKKYEKKYPPIVIDYLETTFPRIGTNIHQRLTNPSKDGPIKVTPLELAIFNNNIDLVNAILTSVSFEEVIANEPYILNVVASSNDEVFYALMHKLSEFPLNKINETVLGLIMHITAGSFNEKRLNNVLDKFNVNFMASESQESVKRMIRSCIASEVDSFTMNVLFKLLNKVNFEVLNDRSLGNINAVFEVCLQGYRRMTEEVLLFSLVREPKNTPEIIKLKQFINRFIKALPPNLKDKISESVRENVPFACAIALNDEPMARFLLENTRIIPILEIRSVIKSKKIERINNLKILSEYFDDEKIVDELLKDMLESPNEYTLEVFQQLPELPFTWNIVQKGKLFDIMKARQREFGGEETIQQWLGHFKKRGALLDEIIKNIRKSMTTDIEIDDKLFGHINNDHALKGTTLQGLFLSASLKYFNKFVNDFKNSRWNIAGVKDLAKIKMLDNLEKIQAQFLNCLVIEEILTNSIENDELNKHLPKEEIVENISEHIANQLIANDGGLIPGGWIGLNNTPGHAMLYELRKTAEGYQFIIHNSGAGINHHEKLEKPSASFYATSKVYEIPTHSIADFKKNLKKLLKPMVNARILPAYYEPHDTYDGDRLYSEIAEKAYEIGLREVPATPKSAEWTKSQSSGTCAWWALRSYLKSHCSAEEGISYEDLNYEVRRFSIADYYLKNEASNTLKRETAQNQLNFATRNLARDLRKLTSGDDELANERRKEGLALLNKIAEVKEQKEKHEKKLQKELSKEGKKEMRFEFDRIETSLSELSSHKIKATETSNYESVMFDPRKPLQAFGRLFDLSRENLKNKNYFIVSKAIEEFYLSLPSDISVNKLGLTDQKMQSEALMQFLDILKNISSIYMVSIGNQSIIPFAEQLMVPLISQNIAANIMDIYFKELPEVRDVLARRLNDSADAIKKSSYFTNPDPLNNDRIQGSEIFPEIWEDGPLAPATLVADASIQLAPATMAYAKQEAKEDLAIIFNAIINGDKMARNKILELIEQDKEIFGDIANHAGDTDAGIIPDKDNLTLTSGDELQPVSLNGLQPASLVGDTKSLSELDNLQPAALKLSTSSRGLPDLGNLQPASFTIPSLGPKGIEKKPLQDSTIKIPDNLKISFYYLQNREKLKKMKEFENIETGILCVLNSEKIRSDLMLYSNGCLDVTQGADVAILNEFFRECDKQLETNFRIEMSNSGNFYLSGNLNLANYQRGRRYNTLEISQPTMTSELISKCLKTDSWGRLDNSNTIQTQTVVNTVTESVAFERSLRNTNVDSRTQISATVDLAKKEFLRFENVDFQNFVFLNLFQGNLLQDQLKDSHSIAENLIALIKRGLASFSEIGRLKQPALFMLKLSLFLEINLSRLPKSYGSFEKELNELDEIHKVIAEKIVYYNKLVNKNPAGTHKNTLRILHGYNIIHLRNQLRLTPKIETNTITSVLRSWIAYKNLIEKDPFDPFLNYQINKAFTDISPHLPNYCDYLLKNDTEKFKQMLNGFIISQGISVPVEKCQWTGKFPVFALISNINRKDIVVINLLSGDIYQNEILKISLPSIVYNNPLFMEIVKAMPAGLVSVSPDKNVYEFSVEGVLYRFNIESRQGQPDGVLYRQIEVEGVKDWYEYQARPNMDFPVTLTEKGNSIWVSTSKTRPQQTIIVKESSKQLLVLGNEKGLIAELNAKTPTNRTGFYLININRSPDLQKNYVFLNSVENPKFIQFWKKEDKKPPSGEILIKLVRYGLTFRQKVNSDGTLGDIIWDKDPRYKLKTVQDNLIPNFKGFLQLQTVKEKEDEDLAIIPKQLFTVSETFDQEYYGLEFDTNNEVLKGVLYQQNSGYDSLGFLNPIKLHLFTNQEQYMTFKVKPNEKVDPLILQSDSNKLQLKPENNDERIYLAYILLAKRKPSLAYEYLKQVALPLTLSQIEGLKNIILDIPIKIGDKVKRTLAEKALIESPEFVAVRTLAASLLIEQKINKHPVKFPTTAEIYSHSSPISLHQEYEVVRFSELQKFWNDSTFVETINPIYKNYLKHLRKVPGSMRLETLKERQLLRYQMARLSDIPPHFQIRRNTVAIMASIQLLKNLENDLKKLKPNTQQFNKITREVKRLESRINRLKSVVEEHNEIHSFTIKLFPDKEIIFQYPSERDLLNDKERLRKANLITVENLNPYINDADFFHSFSSYLKMALESKDDTGKRETLNKKVYEICKLIALKRQKNPNMELSPRENVSIILAYILKYPNSFAKPSSRENLDEYLKQQLTTIDKIIRDNVELDVTVQVPIKVRGILNVVELPVVEPIPININRDEIAKAKLETSNLLPSLKAKFAELYAKEHKTFEDTNLRKNALASQQEIKRSLEFLESRKDMEPHQKVLIKEKLLDDHAGIEQNLKIQMRNMVASVFCEKLGKDSDRKIRIELETTITKKSVWLDRLKEEIVKLANKAPRDAIKRLEWELQLKGEERSPLTFEKILRMYLTQDLNYYKQSTALEDADIKNLNNSICQFLIESTELQKDQRMALALNKLCNPKLSTEDKASVINKIGLLLELERCYDPITDPEALVFEYLDDKLLFKEQYQYLKGFLKKDNQGFSSQAVQLIMGGGKSKVLLPLLALKKAEGNNLSIIEVPDALFQINRADLKAIIKEKFGQELQSFYFDETINCDVEYLKNLRNMIKDAMLNRQSLITTKESMQAFELHFIKFLKTMDPSNPVDNKKAKLCTEILSDFKYRGDVIIDEIDSTLDVRKQLIYTVGTGVSIPKQDLKSVLDLFTFLEKLSIPISKKPAKTIAIKNLISGLETCSEVEWQLIFQFIAEQLVHVTDPIIKNPLAAILGKIYTNKSALEIKSIKEILVLYLQGKHKEPNFLLNNTLTSVERDRIAIYREEITTILGLTLKKNLQEHFGFSKDPNKQEIEREIAIPFIASNTPSEKSKFGNYLETINYTLRIQLNQLISINVIKSLISHFKAKAEEERILYSTQAKPENYKSPEDHFQELTNYSLVDIDFEDKRGFDTFYEKIKSDPKVKEYCLLNYVLNHIENHECILASDAQNHGSQFRSVQGMTGTDWNYRCYPRHPYVATDKNVSLGSDGQTRNHLLREPIKSHLLPMTGVSNEAKIKLALDLFKNNKNKKKLHAWIDLGAYFKGIANNTVAGYMAQFFAASSDFKHLKYVLFFGEDNKLYALPTKKSSEPTEPIPLERTDSNYILETLNGRGEKIGLENLFTYYDQRRTTGTDISQELNAHAFVPIGLKTTDRDLLQGVMRLRELSNKQRVEFVIPKEVQDANPTVKEWDIKTILNVCFNNQIERLADDHYRSALQKIQNTIRNDLFERLLSSSDPAEQRKWMDHFDKIFFKIEQRTAFVRFGHATTRVLTSDRLQTFGKHFLNEWLSIIKLANIQDISSDEIESVQNEIRAIIMTSIDICNKEVEQLKIDVSLYDSQVEISKEEETENEDELELQIRALSVVRPLSIKKLKPIDFDIFEVSEGLIPGGGGLSTMALENMMRKTPASDLKDSLETSLITEGDMLREGPKRSWNFSNNIFVSGNFSQTYINQLKGVDGYTKDALFFLAEQDDSPPTSIKFVLITPEEAGHFRDEMRGLSQSGSKKFWVETAHNTVQSGMKPEKLHPDYQKCIEQIAFFVADTDILVNGLKEDKDSWIKDKSHEKLQFLEQVLYPIHRDKVNMIDSIRERLKLPTKAKIFSTASGPKVQQSDDAGKRRPPWSTS